MVEVPVPKAIQIYPGEMVGQFEETQDCDQEKAIRWDNSSVGGLVT